MAADRGRTTVQPSLFRLIEEKLPLLGLAAASAASTVWRRSYRIAGHHPVEARLANAVVAYVVYSAI